MIHPTSIISPKALIPKDNHIGPYCIIDENVKMGEKNIENEKKEE